jgi:hypothetical protein
MDTPFYQKPLPALAIAVGLGVASSKANTNAAKAFGMPLLAFSALLALALMTFGLAR